jgi:Domain of unknown function (DUF6916)
MAGFGDLRTGCRAVGKNLQLRTWSGNGEAGMDEPLKLEDFKPHVGKIVRFKGTRYAFPLERIVSDRKRLPKWVTRRPFILIFVGPKEPDVMPEGFYDCEIDGGPVYQLYVNPIHTPDPGRQEYQSVFN